MSRSGAGRYVGAFVLLIIVAGMLFMYNKMLSKAKSSTATAQQTVPVAVQQRRDEPPEQRKAPERDGDPGLPAVWAYEIKAEYPHDKRAYLQGLAYHDGKLYESTGIYGETTVREVELKTGKVVKSTALGREHFGEGLTVYQGDVYSLTWRSPRGFRFDLKTLALKSEFRTPYRDGWGLAHDGRHFIVTDSGTDLFFLDPATMREVRRVTVRDGEQAIEMVNELEYIEGEVYANVFQKECIARIDPATGSVKGWIVLDDILDRVHKADQVHDRLHDNVLNGIAYNTETKNLLVSGKRWPSLFEISLTRKEAKQDDVDQVRRKCIPAFNVFRRL